MKNVLILFDTKKRFEDHHRDFAYGNHTMKRGQVSEYCNGSNRTMLMVNPVVEKIQSYCCPIILVGYGGFSEDVLQEVRIKNSLY